MRPRGALAGQRAAGHGGQSWKVGKWLRLHSCDWPSGHHHPLHDFTRPGSASRPSSPPMKERERGRDDQESVKEQWGDELTTRERRTCSARRIKNAAENESD